MSVLLLVQCFMCGQLLPKMQMSSQAWCNSLWSCICTLWILRDWQWLLDSSYILILKWWHQGPLSHLSLCSISHFSSSPTLLPPHTPTGKGLSVWFTSWQYNNINNTKGKRQTWCSSNHLCVWAVLETFSTVNLHKDKSFLSPAEKWNSILHMSCLYLALIYFPELRGFGHDKVVQ